MLRFGWPAILRFTWPNDLRFRQLQQGFAITQKKQNNKKSNSDYFFTEFFMKDSLGKNAKFYRLYGNLPSKHRFVELSLFHNGPEDELVKIIFDLIANNLYLNEERFYNPYILNNTSE